MKIGGKPVQVRERTIDVTIGTDDEGKPVKVRLRAPGVTEAEDMRMEMPFPDAPPVPGQFVRDERGKGFILDDYGRRIPVRNPDDPVFRKRMNDTHILRGVGLVVLCARDIEWETKRTEGMKAEDYYRGIFAEMEKARIDAMTFKRLMEGARSLADGVAVEEQAQARADLGVPENPKT